MTIEEKLKFDNDREEIKNKINEFYNTKNSDNTRIRILASLAALEMDKGEYKIEIEQKKDKGPNITVRASRMQIAYAIHMLLSSTGDYYQMLYMVFAIKEVEKSCGDLFKTAASFQAKSQEELDVIKTLFEKNPEELEALKRQMEKK